MQGNTRQAPIFIDQPALNLLFAEKDPELLQAYMMLLMCWANRQATGRSLDDLQPFFDRFEALGLIIIEWTEAGYSIHITDTRGVELIPQPDESASLPSLVIDFQASASPPSKPTDCHLCQRSLPVVGHHVRYVPEEIKYVCRECHSKIHNPANGELAHLRPKMKRKQFETIVAVRKALGLSEEQAIEHPMIAAMIVAAQGGQDAA